MDKIRQLIVGNWKMNMTSKETTAFLKEFKKAIKGKTITSEVAFCVPFTNLYVAHEVLKKTNIKLGAQNIAFAESGAYTGEISANMLKDLGTSFAIVGHSERRELFFETDEMINKRILCALKHDIRPIVCVGETEKERMEGKANEKVSNQLEKNLKDVTSADMQKVVIAYEPIWAIGTGKTATSEDANEMTKFIRTILEKMYSKDIANCTQILYGGSMNAKNAEELLSKDNINGGLIGGASLKVDDFLSICKL